MRRNAKITQRMVYSTQELKEAALELGFYLKHVERKAVRKFRNGKVVKRDESGYLFRVPRKGDSNRGYGLTVIIPDNSTDWSHVKFSESKGGGSIVFCTPETLGAKPLQCLMLERVTYGDKVTHNFLLVTLDGHGADKTGTFLVTDPENFSDLI